MDRREIPSCTLQRLKPRACEYCVCIPVINEGGRIRAELADMKAKGIPGIADILILDGGSTDGSLDEEYLKSTGVTALLVKTGPGRLGAQLRMGYSFALDEGYKGIVTIDGNGKDNVEAIGDFIRELEAGADLVQGSRFLPGGKAVNTPLSRLLAIRLVHAPIVSALARHAYTDTTNGYRGYSRRLLLDGRVAPFRDVFDKYQIIFYLAVKAPRLGFRAVEIPVTRAYPQAGKVPTKIGVRGKAGILWTLLELAMGRYNPR